MLKRLLSLALILSVTSCIYAQKTKPKSDEPDNKNIDRYLNDGRIGNVQNLIRFRLNPAFSGYFGLSYERKLSKVFGLEAGVYVKATHGILTESYRFDENYSNNGSVEIKSIENGTAFLLYPKFYFRSKSINNGYFVGFRGNYKSYKTTMSSYAITPQTGVVSKATSIFAMIGSHQQFGPRFTWGFEWGAGFYTDTYKNVEFTDYDYSTSTSIVSKRTVKASNLLIAADLSFGFLF
jgi:hypothetical protein